MTIGFIKSLIAQDPQLTQFYAQPLYLNPAFTGTSSGSRIIANFRSQWPSLDSRFLTYALSYDQPIPILNSNIGILLKRDQQVSFSNPNPYISSNDFTSIHSGYQTTDITGFYAYTVPITESLYFQAGTGLSYSFRDVGWNNFIFSNQINIDGSLNSNPTIGLPNNTISFFDMSLGGLLYTSKLWLGFSVNHLVEPSVSLVSNSDVIYRKYGFHAGYKFSINSIENIISRGQELSITPAINYFRQGSAEQLSIGLYSVYYPLLIGVWYRGIPMRTINSSEERTILNQDALAILAGIRLKRIVLGYSYDYTISELANFSGGSHEISLTYNFKISDNLISRNRVNCPTPSSQIQNNESRFIIYKRGKSVYKKKLRKKDKRKPIN